MLSRSTRRFLLPFMAVVLPASRLGADPAPLLPPAATAEELSARRARVLEGMERVSGKEAVLLLRAPAEDHFAGDVDYPYRPDNDLYYLTGIHEPRCALLLAANELGGLGREVLFFTALPPALRQWVGERLTREGASRRSGLPERAILDLNELPGRLEKTLSRGARAVHGPAPKPAGALFIDTGSGSAPGKALAEPYLFLMGALGSRAFHLSLRSPDELLPPLRQVKSASEVALLEKAIDATCKAQLRAWRRMKPGIHEFEVRAVIEETFLREGCSGWSFPPIVASGPNSCILHYQGYSRRTEDGDLVVLDIGAEYGFYSGDVTRTVPVNGRFSPRQREIYDAVLGAQEAAIRAVKPGEEWERIDATAKREVASALLRLGVINQATEAGKYFMHGTSHGLGLDVHDPMPRAVLAPGMVITVEPGIYIAEEGLGVRIEDDVLVTEDGARILSSGLPRSIREIEEYMAGREL